nr:flagellar hook-length control protein FliK [Roseovarius nubinhibens]
MRSISDPLRFGPVSSPPGSATAQAADIGQQIVARLVRAGPDGPRIPGQVDLTLNPAELGRVRLSMAPGEAGLVVTIHADRPETLDLMRRHSEQLMQEFLQAGFERAELSFGGTGSGQARDQMSDQAELLEPDLSEEEGPVAVQAAAQELHLSDGLNLRL